jgi:hypothetical protein
MGGSGGSAADENKQTSDEMSEPDFIRYQAEIERVARKKGYGLVATDTPRRFICSDSPEDIRSASGGQTLERIEAFLARHPDMWD